MKKIVVVVAALITCTVHPMGDGVPKGQISSFEPRYTPLVDGQAILCGKIYDEKVIVELRDLSFSGHTLLEGLRREDDDSSTSINLADYKEIIIDQQIYQSKRYPDKELTLISIVANNGIISKGYLAPCHLVVCGIENNSHAEKAWFLKKIDRIVIDKSNTRGQTTDFVGQIFKDGPKVRTSLFDQTATSTASSMSKPTTVVAVGGQLAAGAEATFMLSAWGNVVGFIKSLLRAIKKFLNGLW